MRASSATLAGLGTQDFYRDSPVSCAGGRRGSVFVVVHVTNVGNGGNKASCNGQRVGAGTGVFIYVLALQHKEYGGRAKQVGI